VILVDTSVWTDYFRNVVSVQTDALDALLETEPILIGDLILTEVLQGFGDDEQFRVAQRLFDAESVTLIGLGSREIAIKAAKNHRALSARGITVRKTIDTIIATRCIEDGLTLLHSDPDFEPFVRFLGLRVLL
jgi:predicted nucleic acid-binding protein